MAVGGRPGRDLGVVSASGRDGVERRDVRGHLPVVLQADEVALLGVDVPSEERELERLDGRPQPEEQEEGQGACIVCGKPADKKVIFARAY